MDIECHKRFYVGDERKVSVAMSLPKGNNSGALNMRRLRIYRLTGIRLFHNQRQESSGVCNRAKTLRFCLSAEPFDKSKVEYDVMAKDPTINKLALKATVNGSAYIEKPGCRRAGSKSGMINKPIRMDASEGELLSARFKP